MINADFPLTLFAAVESRHVIVVSEVPRPARGGGELKKEDEER